MKKICVILLVLVCSSFINSYAFAEESESTFYSNDLGLKLSEEEFNSFSEYLDPDLLDVFSVEEYTYMMQDIKTNVVDSTSIYVKTTYFVNELGEESLCDAYLSEKEMINTINNKNVSLLSLSDRTDTVTTSMKKITMQMINVNLSSKTVTLTCEWLSIPKVKSFDVIAFRTGAKGAFINTSLNSNIYGIQYYNDSKINYYYGYDNIKMLDNGIGISMNIVDSTSTKLKCIFKVVFGQNITTGNDRLLVFGTYQHATTNVTLKESQNYSLSVLGLGNVLNFSNSVILKYDNTPGLEVMGGINDK